MTGPDDELRELVEAFNVAQRRLIEATGGKIDAVLVPPTGLVLLPAAQQQLMRSEAEHRQFAAEKAAILDALPAHIALLSPAGRVLTVNQAWRDFADADGLTGALFGVGTDYPAACEKAVGIGDQARDVASGLRSILRGATTPISIEYACQSSGGQRWFRLLVSAMPRDSGYGAVVMHVDIGARKEAEAHAREIGQRLKTLVNEAPVGIMVHHDWKMIMANDELARIFGYANKEAILAEPDLRVFFAPQERARISAYYEARRRGESAPNLYDTKGQKTDGTLMDLEAHAFELDWGDQTVICAMLSDVTEQRSTEAQLRQLQKMEAVGQLTGGIAHDFNNILMVILSSADAVLEDKDMPAEVRLRLEQIRRAAERAADLTRSLLAFSRKLPLRPQRTDVNELVVNVGEMLRRTLGARIEIDSVLADDLAPVSIDRGQLESALVNLCINARDAMPDGGRLLIETTNEECREGPETAASTAHAAGAYVVLTVTDSGSGIAPEFLAKVFEPFFTTKEVGKGTGLGLSMVYGFVKQSGGHTYLESEVGSGTTIKLYFPRNPEVAARAVVVVPGMPRGTERILVVEDDPRVCAAVVGQLRSLGYAVDEAASGEDGLAAFQAAVLPYDLVLTDVIMPGPVSSKALADAVARLRPQARVLFMSGYSNEAIAHDGRLDPGVHLLSKPFRKMDLAKAIRTRLAGDGS